MGERDDARHQVEQKRERIGALAHEVSRRMTPEYAKERAREMARHRATQMRDRAVDNPWLVPLIGAGVGALVGRAIVSRAEDRRDGWRDHPDRRWSREYGYDRGYGYAERGYGTSDDRYTVGRGAYPDDLQQWPETEGGSSQSRVAGAASDMKDKMSEKAGEMKDKLLEGTSALRERIPGRETIRSSAYEDTGLWALGAVALGALFGFVLPVSQREREMLEPAKEKLREAGRQATETALDKGSAAMDKMQQKVDRPGEDDDRGTLGADVGNPNPPTPIH